MAEIDQFLKFMIRTGASDFHLRSSVKPMFRVQGKIVALTGRAATPFTPESVSQLVEEILPDANREQCVKTRDTDFAYELPGLARFRVNAFEDKDGVGAVFRHIPTAIQTGKKLGMQALNDHLLQLVKQHTVDPAEAYLKSVDKADMSSKLKVAGFPLSDSWPGQD